MSINMCSWMMLVILPVSSAVMHQQLLDAVFRYVLNPPLADGDFTKMNLGPLYRFSDLRILELS